MRERQHYGSSLRSWLPCRLKLHYSQQITPSTRGLHMRKVSDYRAALKQAQDLRSYLLAESGLTGPRGNIELAQAVADFGDEALFTHLLTFTPDVAPTNSPQEFLAFCGAVGLGK